RFWDGFQWVDVEKNEADSAPLMGQATRKDRRLYVGNLPIGAGLADKQLSEAREQNLYLHLDEVNTSILRLADISPALPAEWPGYDDVRGIKRGYIAQRIMRFQISAAPDHHTLYRDKLMPALAREGAELISLIDMLIGDGTTNGKSMQSVELRRFPDLANWQR
ncbi:MAG: hypothetical protein VXW49_10230, partial [Pseudomonadota bacterium]|nr:hypothetical protein [Pseudomonadota bacterium]